jgi:predicted dehydrogenase
MLGTGLIGVFYTMTLDPARPAGPRPGPGRLLPLRGAGAAFRERWGIPESTTSVQAAVDHPEVDTVVVGLDWEVLT